MKHLHIPLTESVLVPIILTGRASATNTDFCFCSKVNFFKWSLELYHETS